MAKDLPYFKFNVSEWNDGDITLCSMTAQGLFVNLCSLYWSQEGNLSLTKSKRRFKDCNTTVWEELTGEGIIKVDGDNIRISFLDEQFAERKKLSETNAKNVQKRWKNTTVLPSNNNGKEPVYNIEKKRKEEKRGEERRFVAPEVFGTNKEAHTFLTTNHQDLTAAKKVLTNLGWPSIRDNDVSALAYHFVEKNLDILSKPRDEVRKHFQNWLNKVPLQDLMKLSVKIIANEERKQRQSTEVR